MDSSAGNVTGPSPTQITDTNKGPLIGVVTWLCMVMALLATVARVASKLILTGRVKVDDGLIVVSTVGLLFPGIFTITLTLAGDGSGAICDCAAPGVARVRNRDGLV